MFTTRGLSTERGRLKMGKWNSPNLSETQGFECLGHLNFKLDCTVKRELVKSWLYDLNEFKQCHLQPIKLNVVIFHT